MKRKRVVVVGTGVIACNGTGNEAFATSLKNGVSGIKYIANSIEHNFRCEVGGVPDLSDPNGKFYLNVDNGKYKGGALTKKMYKNTTDEMCWGLLACVEAAEASGVEVNLKKYKNTPVDMDSGVIYGTGLNGGDVICDEVIPMLDEARDEKTQRGQGCVGYGTTIPQRTMGSSIVVPITQVLGLGGISIANSAACATGTQAINIAWYLLASGIAKSMYCGGSEGVSMLSWGGFTAMEQVLSTYCFEPSGTRADPTTASRPMDRTACGFVPAGGAGALRLTTLEYALENDLPIIAEVLGGYGNSGGMRDGGSITLASHEGLLSCITAGMKMAGVNSDDIVYINGHLTSTGQDPREIAAWLEALDLPPNKFPWINSTKSMIGHSLGAAGSIEAVACILQLKNAFIHPSINIDEVHPDIQAIANKIPAKTVEMPKGVVASLSAGFGDVNEITFYTLYDGSLEPEREGGKDR